MLCVFLTGCVGLTDMKKVPSVCNENHNIVTITNYDVIIPLHSTLGSGYDDCNDGCKILTPEDSRLLYCGL